MRLKRFLLPAVILCWMAQVSAVMADTPDIYRLRQGDAMVVSVWGEEALQREVRVLPDGSITFPLAGRVEVAGLTSPEVEKRITDKLKDYLPEPQVTVVVTGIEGGRAFIIGKVNRPGPIVITGPMTVLQALSMAGGMDKFADLNAIKVVRETPSGQEVVPVPYNKLIKGQELEMNILLQAGDTILVP